MNQLLIRPRPTARSNNNRWQVKTLFILNTRKTKSRYIRNNRRNRDRRRNCSNRRRCSRNRSRCRHHRLERNDICNRTSWTVCSCNDLVYTRTLSSGSLSIGCSLVRRWWHLLFARLVVWHRLFWSKSVDRHSRNRSWLRCSGSRPF